MRIPLTKREPEKLKVKAQEHELPTSALISSTAWAAIIAAAVVVITRALIGQ